MPRNRSALAMTHMLHLLNVFARICKRPALRAIMNFAHAAIWPFGITWAPLREMGRICAMKFVSQWRVGPRMTGCKRKEDGVFDLSVIFLMGRSCGIRLRRIRLFPVGCPGVCWRHDGDTGRIQNDGCEKGFGMPAGQYAFPGRGSAAAHSSA